MNGSGTTIAARLTNVATSNSPARIFAKSRSAKENGLTKSSNVSTRVTIIPSILNPLKKNLNPFLLTP